MTSLEFSNEFEILYNNIMSNQSPGIDEYEKSVFLTKAQLELVKNYFNSKGNKYQEGYDDSAKRQYDFSTLTTIKRYTKPFNVVKATTGELITVEGKNDINFREIYQYFPNEDFNGKDIESVFPISSRDINIHRYKYTLPQDFLFFLNEEVELERLINGSNVHRGAIVTPININELTTLRGGVYKFPVQNECWRVINTITGWEVEILPPYASEIINYSMRYVRKPKPIVLINIEKMYGTTIDGYSGDDLPDDVSTREVCELPEAMHPEIVQRAVELAKASYRTGELDTTVNMGQRTE